MGNDVLSVEQERKSISSETTFNEDIVGKAEIEKYIFHLTSKVAQQLRNENWQASTISIKLRYSDFSTLTRAKTLLHSTDDDKTIYDTSVQLFRQAYTRRVGVRLIGIHLGKLNHSCEQEFLFEDEEIIRKRMLGAVTKIRDKFGANAIHIGVSEKD